MNWLESLIYGLVSGMTEFLPVSSRAHQSLFIHIFGIDNFDPVHNLVVHLALLYSLFTGCRSIIDPIRREKKARLHRRRGYERGGISQLNLMLVKNASLPMLIGFLLLYYSVKSNGSLLPVSLFLLVNGIILYASERLIHANKDARSMTQFDSLLIGLSGAISGLTGISRMGATASAAVARGADRQNALSWAFLLSIPALALLAGMDVFEIFFGNADIHFWSSFFTYILSAVGAYIGGYISIILVKFLTLNTGFYGFAYYSWGAALFTFILYLTVV